MNAKILGLTALIALTGCTSTPKIGTTLPGETDHQAIGTGYTSDDSLKMAAYTAEQYCTQQGKRHAIKSTQNEYRGVISETSRNALDTVASLAAATGNWLPTPGDDTDYKTTVEFICI